MSFPSDDQDTKLSNFNVVTQLVNLFVSPSLAFDYMSSHRRSWWAPYGLTVLLAIGVGLWFSLGINLDIWRETMIQAATARAPQEAHRITTLLEHRGREFLLIAYAAGPFIGLTLLELIYALYLYLADNLLSSSKHTYSDWFNFTAWVWLPKALGYIAILITFAISPSNLTANELDITSLNALFFHLSESNRFFGVAHFSILYVWVIWLTAYGLRHSVGYGLTKAGAVAFTPFFIVYLLIFFH